MTTPGPFVSATAMLDALDKKQVSAVELLQLHLQRIARHNPAPNAIVVSHFERARAQTEAADAPRPPRRARAPPPPPPDAQGENQRPRPPPPPRPAHRPPPS